MTPAVAVIVLNYNGRRWLEACLASLLATPHPRLRAMLVDNGSTDGSVKEVRARFPEVEVIANEENLGFSEGNNIGIRAALERGADYIVLLNPDTRVEPDWLAELLAVGESEPLVGILGAVQLAYDSDEFNSWTRTAAASHLDELRDRERARRWIPVEWVEGACFAVKRAVFERVGLLDPIYFAFYEEIDFCRRAALHGYLVALVPRSRVHHQRGGSWEVDARTRRERDYRCDRSQFIYALTEPRRSPAANLGSYLVTLGTKSKDLLRDFSLARAWDLVRMQFDVLGSGRLLIAKYRRDRASG
jgi:GT2 family glycosyltransferase